jgi:hypothetical protein
MRAALCDPNAAIIPRLAHYLVSRGGKPKALWKKCETFHILSVKRFTFHENPVFVEENTPIAQRLLAFVQRTEGGLVAYKCPIGRRCLWGG